MPREITTHVYGDYWDANGEPSELGRVIRRLEAPQDADAAVVLVELVEGWCRSLELPPDCVVVAVPPRPQRAADGTAVVPRIAAAVASALGLPYEPTWLTRAASGPRIRDVAESLRSESILEAGYRADPAVSGRHLVLVDDVVLTGTTTRHLAGLAAEAGAASVTAVVAARTRLAEASPQTPAVQALPRRLGLGRRAGAEAPEQPEAPSRPSQRRASSRSTQMT